MNEWSPRDFEREYGRPARWCEYGRGDLVQFVTDEGEVLVGKVLYVSQAGYRWWSWITPLVLIVVTSTGDEWWVSLANVVIPG